MPEFSPIQPAFNAGEWSPRAHGRMDTPGYKRALSLCENFVPTPQGSLLMRAGTKRAGGVEDGRLIPFLSSEGERYMLVLEDAKLSVYTEAGVLAETSSQLITNGHFDTDIAGWTPTAGNASWGSSGVLACRSNLGMDTIVTQDIATVAGHTYNFSFRVRRNTAATHAEWSFDGINWEATPTLDAAWRTFSDTFVAAGPVTTIYLKAHIVSIDNWAYIDDVSVSDQAGSVVEIAAPWTLAQLPEVQWDAEPVKNRVVFTHPVAGIWVLTFTVPNVWELYEAVLTNKPAEWGSGNWPRAVELGFQGRSWFAGTPASPHTIWYSKSGNPFNFDTGTSQPDESSSFVVSTKGAIRWLRGQKNLLAGSSVLEHSASGSNRIIVPGDVDVQDQSAFGSAAVQAQHIGDEVVFVGRDRRTIRSLSYDWGTKNGWVVQALSFIAEHMTKGKQVKEIHFTYNPDPILFVLFTDGTLIGSVHDRGTQVEAWFRMPVGNVRSCGMLDGDDGGVLWMIVERSGAYVLEILPLHEVGVQYLDAWVTSVVVPIPADPEGRGHIPTPYPAGTELRAFLDGLLESDVYTAEAMVVGSHVVFPADAIGKTAVVGLAYRARATTLPLEGGNPGGTMQGKESHYSVLMARLNDSAPVLLGAAGGDLERVGDGRPFSTPLDAAEASLTGDYSVGNVALGAGAKVAIEQDLPFRTEVCALFGDVQFADL